MKEILAHLQSIAPNVSKTTMRQMSHIIYGMLVITGRVSMLGLSRWTEDGGSYRSIQRFYQTVLPWAEIMWTLFMKVLWKPGDEYILAGDEVVVSKAGKKTYGLERFFSSLEQRPISAISFFTFSLLNVSERHSYPMQTTQIVKSAEEKAANKLKTQAHKANKSVEKKAPGRPKGSKNKNKQAVVLNAELLRIEQALRRLLEIVRTTLSLKYIALDGHFGNYPSAWMIRQTNLHIISKLRADAALYLPFEGQYSGIGRPAKYGDKINLYTLDRQYLKESSIENNMRTDIYQATLLNKEFDFALNVVIVRLRLQCGRTEERCASIGRVKN